MLTGGVSWVLRVSGQRLGIEGGTVAILRACLMPDAPRKVHPAVQDAGDIHGPAGHRVDHNMLLDIESPVAFGEVGPSVPQAGVVGDRLESLMERGGVDLPLPLYIGFIRVL